MSAAPAPGPDEAPERDGPERDGPEREAPERGAHDQDGHEHGAPERERSARRYPEREASERQAPDDDRRQRPAASSRARGRAPDADAAPACDPAGDAGVPVPRGDDPSRRALASYARAFGSGRADAVAAHYAPRAVVVASDGGTWRGRTAIRGLFAEVFEAGMRELRSDVGPRRRGPEGLWLAGSFALMLADGREGARGRWRAAAAPPGWRGGRPTEDRDLATAAETAAETGAETAAETGGVGWLIRRHVFTVHEARVPLNRRQAVQARVARIAALVNRGAVDAAARIYSEDAVLRDPDGATYLGRGGAISVLSGPLARGYRELEVRVREAVVVGEEARLAARFRWSRPEPPARVEGDVHLDLRRTDGVWWVDRQVVTGVRRD